MQGKRSNSGQGNRQSGRQKGSRTSSAQAHDVPQIVDFTQAEANILPEGLLSIPNGFVQKDRHSAELPEGARSYTRSSDSEKGINDSLEEVAHVMSGQAQAVHLQHPESDNTLR